MLYPAMTVFVNLSNSYDKPDILPELKEMAKFAKQHVPEDHEKVGAPPCSSSIARKLGS